MRKDILERVKSRDFLKLALIGILIVLPVLVNHDQYLVHVFFRIFLYAYLCIVWNVIAGFTGQFSFANTVFFGLSSYVSVLLLLWLGLPPWIGMFVGAATVAVTAGAVFYPCFKLGLTGLMFGLFSAAFNETVMAMMKTWRLGQEWGSLWIPQYKNQLLYMRFTSNEPFYYIMLGATLIVFYAVHRLVKSRLGYFFIAIRENEEAAQSIGINTTKYKTVSAMITAFLFGSAGPIYTLYLGMLHPNFVFSPTINLEIIMATTAGGLGSLFGPIYGSVLLVALSELSRVVFGAKYMGLHLIGFGFLVLAVILFYPKGFAFGIARLRLLLKGAHKS